MCTLFNTNNFTGRTNSLEFLLSKKLTNLFLDIGSDCLLVRGDCSTAPAEEQVEQGLLPLVRNQIGSAEIVKMINISFKKFQEKLENSPNIPKLT